MTDLFELHSYRVFRYSDPTHGDLVAAVHRPHVSLRSSLPFPQRRKPTDDVRRRTPSVVALWKGRRRTKGHQDYAIALRQAMLPGTGMSTEAMLATMRATIQPPTGPGTHDGRAPACRQVDWEDTAEANRQDREQCCALSTSRRRPGPAAVRGIVGQGLAVL